MTCNRQLRDEISGLIDAAFGDDPVPKEYPLTGYESRYDDYEGITVRRYFMGRSWQSLEFHDARSNLRSPIDAALAFMPERIAFYYLPFFMKVSLLGPEVADTAFDSAIFFVTPGRRFSFPDGWDVFTSMGQEKKRTIALWLKFFME